jgi:hypothetical protein
MMGPEELVMNKTTILLKNGDAVTGRLVYAYEGDLYAGTLSFEGPKAPLLRDIFSQALSVYVPELGGPYGGDAPHPEVYGWVLGVAMLISGSATSFFSSYQVLEPPAPELFKKVAPLSPDVLA